MNLKDDGKTWSVDKTLEYVEDVHDKFGHFAKSKIMDFIIYYLQKNSKYLSKAIDKVLEKCYICIRINRKNTV